LATAIPADPLAGGAALDITRSVSRLHLPAPTGIDRIEAAWLDWLRRRAPRLMFLIRAGGQILLLDREGGEAVLAQGRHAPLDWRAHLSRRPEPVRRALSRARSRALAITRADRPDPAALAPLAGMWLFNLGHTNLSPALMAALAAAGARRAVMIHDTIPLDHPEYCRPQTPARFREMFRAACAADLMLANSAHTAGRIRHWAGALGLEPPPIHVAHPGIDPPRVTAQPAERPYFVMLGTIEPRKGHEFLLDLWEQLGPDPPGLEIVGRRGWRIAALARRLDALPPTGPIRERGALADAELVPLLAGARALLMPSRAEGFGLPLAEALAAGVPAIVSDLPALREAGGPGTLYLPCNDAGAWADAIRNIVDANAPTRQNLVNQLKNNRRLSWNQHFRRIEQVMTQMYRNSGV